MSFERATELESQDDLSDKRELFRLPKDIIYLNGNSLGPLPTSVLQRLDTVLSEEWGEGLISSWNKHGWIDLSKEVGEKIAPIIGAAGGQVICCDSISINLFKLLASCLQLKPDRKCILSQKDNFPTDLYVAQGLQNLLGAVNCELKMVNASQLIHALSENVAVLMLSHVNFRDGAAHDIDILTKAAHERGALVIWDLAHSAGVVPLSLDEWDVDFAVGCGYKYLNGGPGAPSFVYINNKHHNNFTQPVNGWMGHLTPFNFDKNFVPAKGVDQFMTGTPPILSLAALDEALSLFIDIDVAQLQKKHMLLSEYFLDMVKQHSELNDLQLVSPRNANKRGAQLSFSHPEAYAICRAWEEAGVIADFRSPNLLRVGFSPLVLCFAEIGAAVEALAEVVGSEIFAESRFQRRLKVT